MDTITVEQRFKECEEEYLKFKYPTSIFWLVEYLRFPFLLQKEIKSVTQRARSRAKDARKILPWKKFLEIYLGLNCNRRFKKSTLVEKLRLSLGMTRSTENSQY